MKQINLFDDKPYLSLAYLREPYLSSFLNYN